MNLNDWKAHCESLAGHPIRWNDVKDAYWGMTSWGQNGDGVYSIIPAHDPQAVVIKGDQEIPLWISSDENNREPTGSVTQPSLFA